MQPAAATTAAAAAVPAGLPQTITVGRLTLSFCNSDYNGYCGAIDRPLDATGHAPGTVSVGFEYYPRLDRTHPSLGTFLPQEGGPGYSSTGTRDAYLSLLSSLRQHRDVLIVDKRGTGLSDPLDCPALQASDPGDHAAVADCARQLGSTAWYYGTVAAAADVVAVLDALDIGQVDFYGDSYGTYFGQTLAARHPDRLRSIILDSAYPVRPPDAWFPTDWQTARDGFDKVCARSVSCAALGAPTSARLAALLAELRSAPIAGQAPDATGSPQPTSVDAPALFRTLDAAGDYVPIYRDFDAAARAWLDDRDALPLLRLAAEVDTGGASDPSAYSGALYTAVICEEYPLLYSLADAPARRRADYKAGLQALRAARPALFAPFTIDEMLASGTYITPLDICLDWPAPPPGYAQGDALPPHPVFPPVPTLVLSGDLDAVTSPVDASQAASQFPVVTHLLAPNLTHITAFSDEDNNIVVGGDLTACVSNVARRFVVDRKPGATGCLADIRPIRTVPRFSRWSAELAPAIADAGNRASEVDLKVAAAALETVGDAIARFYVSTSGTESGLRGGSVAFAQAGSGYHYDLTDVQWTEDVSVSGTIDWNQITGDIQARVDVVYTGARLGSLSIQWNDRETAADATIRGALRGRELAAHRIAP